MRLNEWLALSAVVAFSVGVVCTWFGAIVLLASFHLPAARLLTIATLPATWWLIVATRRRSG